MKKENIGSFTGVNVYDKASNEEKRKDLFHNAIHTIALLCVAVFVILVTISAFFSSVVVPDFFISTVSTIIGFYFGNRISFK